MSRKSLILIAIVVAGFVFGIVIQAIPALRSPATLILQGAVTSFLAFAWYCYDTDERRLRRSTLGNSMVIGFGLFTYPLYLIRTRGVWRGLWLTCVSLLLLLASGVAEVAGAVVGSMLHLA